MVQQFRFQVTDAGTRISSLMRGKQSSPEVRPWCDSHRAPGGGTPYDGRYGEAPPERGTFFRLQVHERVGISLVEVNERVGKSVIWVCKRAQKCR